MLVPQMLFLSKAQCCGKKIREDTEIWVTATKPNWLYYEL